MGHITPTPAGTYRANWRDATGKQRAKTFRTKKEASLYLAEVETNMARGTYVDPRAGKQRFGDFAARWLLSREVEARTAERTLSLLRTHLLPRWGLWQLGQIDYMSVQEWVVDLGKTLAPPTVSKCHGLLLAILQTAVRARIIAVNPAEDVKVRGETRDHKPRGAVLSREAFFTQLLPAVPPKYRPIVCTAAGAGLRWGECAGLMWNAVDLDAGRLTVIRVAVETPGAVTIREYPKSRAGVRWVPMPDFLVSALTAHRKRRGIKPEADGLVFASRVDSAPRRSNFRRRVWVPALARTSLPASLRFHDLRHSYATWLITDGVPVNAVQKVMGHANASTTLDRYTHPPEDYEGRVRGAMEAGADFPLTFGEPDQPKDDNGPDDASLLPA